jgi:hypothetical protein
MSFDKYSNQTSKISAELSEYDMYRVTIEDDTNGVAGVRIIPAAVTTTTTMTITTTTTAVTTTTATATTTKPTLVPPSAAVTIEQANYITDGLKAVKVFHFIKRSLIGIVINESTTAEEKILALRKKILLIMSKPYHEIDPCLEWNLSSEDLAQNRALFNDMAQVDNEASSETTERIDIMVAASFQLRAEMTKKIESLFKSINAIILDSRIPTDRQIFLIENTLLNPNFM